MPDSGETRATLSSSPLMRTIRVPTGLSACLAQAPTAGISPVFFPQQEEKSPRRINFMESEELDSNSGSASSRPCGLRLVTQHLSGGGSGPPGKVDAGAHRAWRASGARGVCGLFPGPGLCAAIHSLCASSRCWATKQVCAVASGIQDPGAIWDRPRALPREAARGMLRAQERRLAHQPRGSTKLKATRSGQGRVSSQTQRACRTQASLRPQPGGPCFSVLPTLPCLPLPGVCLLLPPSHSGPPSHVLCTAAFVAPRPMCTHSHPGLHILSSEDPEARVPGHALIGRPGSGDPFCSW